MKAPALKFPIGKSDFTSVRQGNYHYVDKSLFIEQIIQDSAEVLLFPRPRRFGKTLNLSMLKAFVEKPKLLQEAKETTIEEKKNLFSGLAIEKSKEVWDHFGKYPVIFITLKDIKSDTFAESYRSIVEIVAALYEEHRYLLDSSVLSQEQKQVYEDILSRKANDAQYGRSLLELSKSLHAYHQEKVIILIDEYDSLLHSGHVHDYYQNAVSFCRLLFSSCLKDNPHLFKGVLTGILRIARESIFSDLNNLSVYSFLSPEFATSFGFTEEEVLKLIVTYTKKVDHPQLLSDIKSWYNGYLFGEQYEIYNPWSVLSFLQYKKLKAYWVNTSSHDLIKKTLFNSGISTQEDIETLLQGGEIDKPLEENLVLRELNADSIWSLLLFSGYLKATAQYSKDDLPYGKLAIPNREVRTAFLSLSKSWFRQKLGPSRTVESLIKSLFLGDAEKVEDFLSYLMKVSMSYLDVKPEKAISQQTLVEEKTDPEHVYHAFFLGMLVNLGDNYNVRSNRESGYGRPDMMLIPKHKGNKGVVMEFKILKKDQTLQKAFEEAWEQMEEKEYKVELQEQGVNSIIEYVVVFSGKQAFVRSQRLLHQK